MADSKKKRLIKQADKESKKKRPTKEEEEEKGEDPLPKKHPRPKLILSEPSSSSKNDSPDKMEPKKKASKSYRIADFDPQYMSKIRTLSKSFSLSWSVV